MQTVGTAWRDLEMRRKPGAGCFLTADDDGTEFPGAGDSVQGRGLDVLLLLEPAEPPIVSSSDQARARFWWAGPLLSR
jgi:hypothetical protein